MNRKPSLVDNQIGHKDDLVVDPSGFVSVKNKPTVDELKNFYNQLYFQDEKSRPKKAHWNNADIGSHIMWKRVPNIYERGIYHCLNFFHC